MLAFVLTLFFWIQPHPDADLARAAMQHWQAASEGDLELKETKDEKQATLRFRFVDPDRARIYGTALARQENGRTVQELIINPALAAGEADPLLAATILFLTCVHESGHGLGLEHTRNFDDIMYSFQYGGDIEEYFARYRRRINSRGDFAKFSPVSAGDALALRRQLARQRQSGTRSPAAPPSPPR
jgi:hypothetical protein